MGNSRSAAKTAKTSAWLSGFDISDFRIPTLKKTEIAEVATTVTRAVIELHDSVDFQGERAEDLSEIQSRSALMQVLESWADANVEHDFADRRVEWPCLPIEQYMPDSSADQRIQDNIAAIKLLAELKSTKRPVSNDDRLRMLKYCGWGGLARVFSPDGSSSHKWAEYRDELELLTTKSEFEAMRSSVVNAYYTDPRIVRAVWEMVRQMGFKGGRVLEPSAGPGHFLAGMPEDMAKKSDITAVELDSITAGLLDASFGPLGVQVCSGAFEKAKLPAAFYDLVIGNPPFGDYKSLDSSNADYASWSIHNYFVGKAIDLVRPGGLVVLITSAHTLDSKKDAHRQWISAHAELISAFRLPTMAFKEQANTEAQTDLLIFKRRESPKYGSSGWKLLAKPNRSAFKAGSTEMTWSSGRAQEARINEHFVAHPEHVIGQFEWQSSQHGNVLKAVFDGDTAQLEAALLERAKLLPSRTYEHKPVSSAVAPRDLMTRVAADGFHTPGSFIYKDSKIFVSEGHELLDIDSIYSGTARKRMIGMIELKFAAIDVVEFQAKSLDDAELSKKQGRLNAIYDNFVNECGFISTTANSRLMRGDPDWPMMLALEVWDEEAGVAQKADIFSKRTVGHVCVPERVDNVKDAMLISLGLYGRIVLKDLSLRTGMPVVNVTKELNAQGIAYRDPQLACWVPADEYLSGNIREKIAAANAAGPAYAVNIEPLKQVLPKDLGPMDVEVRLGAPWVPTDVIEQFAAELVEGPQAEVKVNYDTQSASWSINAGYSLEYFGNHALQKSKWGTQKRCALGLLEGALNQTPPTVTQTIDGKAVVDRIATLNARDKWQLIKEHFRNWVYQDTARTERLMRIYNDKFNQVVNRKYDGSHLTLPGMSQLVTPWPHQKDAVWRIVTSGNTLLAHVVGAGKTLVMAAASMELRRLGKAVKPFHVTMNNCLDQYAAEFVRLYPQAKLLIMTKDDLQGDKRRTFLARVSTGDFDAVVMTHSTFERISLSPVWQRVFIEQSLAEARVALDSASDSGAKRSIKEIEKRMKAWEAKVEALVDAKGDDRTIYFDQTGVDYLFFDEIHIMKNLARISKMPRIAGLGNSSSQRAFDFFMKSRYVMSLHGDQEVGVVGSSATPISNSLAELHTMQIYFQPKTLKRLGLYEFDAWASSYGESVTGVELNPDGSGYRVHTRFSKFVNMPELMGIFKGIADVKTRKMLNLPTPSLFGGQPQVMVAEPSEELLAIVDSLIERADKCRSGGVDPSEDNMLKVTSDGRKAALDVRLIDPSLPFNPNGKIALCCNNVYRIWLEGAERKVTQLVFSDLGTPSTDSFNVYSEVKRLLVAKGIPESDIEFVHDHDSDAAKAKLFRRVRDGSVRVLLGSTSKLGTGTNVQRLLKCVHQLDAPWTPAAVEQRDGRAERQGNLNEMIELWRYVTAKSFDSYSWQTLETKARFIEQLFTAESGVRTVEDIAQSALTYAEIKAIASGNPLVLEKATVDADVQKMSLRRSQFEDARWRLAQREAFIVKRLSWIDANMADIESDSSAVASARSAKFVPATSISEAIVKGTPDDSAWIGACFRRHSTQQVLNSVGTVIGRIGQFEIVGVRTFLESKLFLRGPSGFEYEVARPDMNDLHGVGAAVFETLNAFLQGPASLRIEYGEKTSELVTTRELLAQEFEYADELDRLLKRQREIEAELDLDKSEQGTEAISEPS